MNRKVLIIGLDGATFDLLIPMVDRGILPNLERLIKNGVSGPLTSTFPPLTGPAWSSFVTGKSPGHHGVLEFFRREENSYRQILNNRLDIDGKSIWKILSDMGKTVGVMGIPLSYPPESVNGFLITGLLTPSGRRDFTYPSDLLDEIESEVGKYRLRHDEKYRKNNPFPFIDEQFEILENNTQTALYLMRQKPWDVFMLHILGTDRVQHEFWHTIDPNHPNYDPDEVDMVENVMDRFFSKVDESVGRVLDELDEDAVVVIMSDHGFGPVYKFVNVNTWLLNEGLLVLKKDLFTRFRHILFRLGFNYSILGKVILKLGLGKHAKEMGRGKREDWQRRLFLSLNDVDWSKTKVYSIGNFGQLFVNLRGREPGGIVNPGEEYNALLSDVTDRLKKLADPDTHQPIVEEIFYGDDIYSGPYKHRAPDLLFFTKNMDYKAMGLSDFASSKVFDPVYGTTGHHRMNGILIGTGADVFKSSDKISDAKIYDLAPTLLYLMGVGVPREMDGQVLFDLFTDEFKSKNPVEYIDLSTSDSGGSSHELTTDEKDELAERLRSLGYVN